MSLSRLCLDPPPAAREPVEALSGKKMPAKSCLEDQALVRRGEAVQGATLEQGSFSYGPGQEQQEESRNEGSGEGRRAILQESTVEHCQGRLNWGHRVTQASDVEGRAVSNAIHREGELGERRT